MASPRRTELDELGIDGLCDRIVNGMSQADICRELNIYPSNLCYWVAQDVERSARVREARRHASESYVDQAHAAIINARATKEELARAKLLVHHFHWKAANADPDRLGARQNVKADVSLSWDKMIAEASKPEGD